MNKNQSKKLFFESKIANKDVFKKRPEIERKKKDVKQKIKSEDW